MPPPRGIPCLVLAYITGIFHEGNRYEFVSAHETQKIVEAWQIEYNTYRPHSPLNYLTPAEFTSQWEVAEELFPLSCRR